MTSDIFEALENVISLGCERVLTSGGENTALEGTPVIRKLVEQSDGRLVVMPGGGITEKNLRRILDETGAKEFHGSGRRAKASRMEFCNTAVSMGALFGPAEFSTKVTDRDRVKSMLSIAREAT
ncbi:hypothetical protein CAPTEDRAFT_151033 [Capitella teleta]|uniref:Copper homeostasis protein cutC homolog n=1 Tax=Capitella teleta TaxID=283909 RepID=R7TDS8_CAPTE|nr:hypothetical protein CAPTEDRAFT_151033 [Capitella teleta]|eukprot:ELT89647.1 hypothetical protein CAPTEDRAFT_151033 [Capitella teleta]